MSAYYGLMDHPCGNHFRYYWKEFEANILVYYNQTGRSYHDVHAKMLIVYYLDQQMRNLLTVMSVL